MAKKKKNKIWLMFAAVSLCLLVGLAGYKGARLLAAGITKEAEQNAEKAGLFKPKGVEDNLTEKLINGTEKSTASNLRPLSLLYLIDYESGKVEELVLEVFDTVSMKAAFMYLDPDITYTMTGSLYRALANGNVLVPQTVRFSELYGYYGTPAAFDAGKKIAGEMLGTPIDYYAVYTSEAGGEELKIRRITSLGVKSLYDIETGEDTDMSEDEQLVYESLAGYLKDTDINVYEAPVIKHNESCFIDISKTWEILGELLQ
ncbi:MAG: hypothetical protein J5783_05275 [Lachnospiraceae bacterium]|nr:hypothetical protein [Lachnospiraceae bacterium]